MVRYVLVPDLTDGFDNVESVADSCAGLNRVERVQILRFHQLGSDKRTRLRLECPLEKCEAPSADLCERVREPFRSRGSTVF